MQNRRGGGDAALLARAVCAGFLGRVPHERRDSRVLGMAAKTLTGIEDGLKILKSNVRMSEIAGSRSDWRVE